MKTSLINILLFSIIVHSVNAAIAFDALEFKPVGQHYAFRGNKIYYAYYKDITIDKLTLVYYKNGKGVMMFKGLWVSKPLAEKVPMVVIRYIGNYITSKVLIESKSLEEAIRLSRKAVENAMNQKWKINLMANAQVMIANPRYHRGNSIIDNNAYYEFTPHHLSSPDSIKPDYIQLPKSVLSNFQMGELKNNLDAIISSLNNHREHHNNLIVSNWPWRYNSTLKKWELKSDTLNHHQKEVDTCKLIMELNKVNKGQPMPNMCWRQINGASWTGPPTYCNFFAQTLAHLTFGKSGYDPEVSSGTSTGWYPWGGEMTANNIHDYMGGHPESFVDLKWQDCWKYINAGYIVYFVWKNSGGAGHIATGYPTEGNLLEINKIKMGKIVQAGVKERTGIFQLEDGRPWDNDNLKNVKAYLYLGYLRF
jgi:hypothetical protein